MTAEAPGTQAGILDFFKRESITGEWLSGYCLGRPLYIDYDKAAVSISDKEKLKAGGVPNGSFLMAYTTGSGNLPQALLLRVMNALDTRNGSGSGPNPGQDETFMECRVLGTIYPDKVKGTCFGSDVGDLLSPSNYILVNPIPNTSRPSPISATAMRCSCPESKSATCATAPASIMPRRMRWRYS